MRELIDRLDHPDDRDVITRFIRWQILRRMNEEGVTSRGTFLRSKQTVTVAIIAEVLGCSLPRSSSTPEARPPTTPATSRPGLTLLVPDLRLTLSQATAANPVVRWASAAG